MTATKSESAEVFVFPTSFAQEGSWFFYQLEPNSPAYNMPGALRMKGSLDVAALERCLNEIVRRHEVLRTTFREIDGKPVQVVAPTNVLPLIKYDLRHLAPDEREHMTTRLATEEAQEPFDLDHGPVLRTKLLRTADNEHMFILTMHHIVSDQWSMDVFQKELATLYRAYSSGEPSPLPELPIQYADYAVWQREWLQGEVYEELLSYWRNQLHGDLPVLELPFDHPRPPIQTFWGTTQYFELPAYLLGDLEALARKEGCTLFMVLLTAVQTLLHRYTGQDDIITGSPSANRNSEEVLNLLGFFVNMLVLRTDFSGNPTFRELLGRVREVTLGAYNHSDLLFEKLVAELRPKRYGSHWPLFQMAFQLVEAPAPLKLPDIELTPMPVENDTSKFDLSMSMIREEKSLSGVLEYNTDLFEKSTIERFVAHLQTILEAIAADPDRRVSSLPLMRDRELNQLLYGWNETKRQYAYPECVHQIVERQVGMSPRNTAVIFENQQLDYHELNRRANQLAQTLKRQGVGPEVLVGVYMERSIEMVVSLLAILKAGGAYLPLDPAHPLERLGFILDDTGVSFLLGQQRLMSTLERYEGKAICVDAEWESIAGASELQLESEIGPDNLMYVIYTSGSTGKPKGAMLTHRGVRNRLLWGTTDYRLGPEDVVLNKTALSFDVSVWEIFAPLMSGATLALAREGGQQDSSYLVELIRQQRITHVDFVPSMLQVFLEEHEVELCKSLKRITAAGEALSAELVDKYYGVLSADLYNLYGPTETSLAVTYWSCQREDQSRVIPIGRPMANVEIYLLSKDLEPAPVGAIGELHIGGLAPGRGYFNRADQTAEKFIPDAFGPEPGRRLYKTGDLARYLPNGVIEYIGRIDHQVKVRGFRIELGEIEAALLQHSDVEEAVVLAKEEQKGDARLVAYVVADPERQPTVSDLKQYLREKLPRYMEPGAILILERMPLTVNGKVDRAGLESLESRNGSRDSVYEAPRDDLEQALAVIWAEQLGIEQVGIHDNFFEIGGHSLLAIQLLSKIWKRMGENLPVQALFQAPTIAELADILRKRPEARSAPSTLVPLQTEGTLPPLYWIRPMGGQVVAYQHLVDALGRDQPAYGLQSNALERPDHDYNSIEQIAAEYAAAVLQHNSRGPYYLIGWSSGGVIALSVAAELEQQGHAVAFVGLLDSYIFERNSGDPSNGNEDPLAPLALAFGGILSEAFIALTPDEQVALREEFRPLSLEERLELAVAWGRDRKLFAPTFSLDDVEKRKIIENTREFDTWFVLNERLLQAHGPKTVNAPLYIWWARNAWVGAAPPYNWGQYTTGGVHIDTAEGSHFTLIYPPNSQTLAENLRESLRRAREAVNDHTGN